MSLHKRGRFPEEPASVRPPAFPLSLWHEAQYWATTLFCSSIAILPGETAQPIHADDQLIPLPKPHPPTVCNSMWALTDFTAANGATRIIPGTHLADHSPDYGADYDSIAAEMRAGSVLIWHGSLWHGGGANTTDETRMGIAMNYCAGYIRQQENQQLGLSRETVSRFSPRLRELDGYGV